MMSSALFWYLTLWLKLFFWSKVGVTTEVPILVRTRTAALSAQYEPTKNQLPENRKGYDNFETTVGKLSARRIQICFDYFCKIHFWPPFSKLLSKYCQEKNSQIRIGSILLNTRLPRSQIRLRCLGQSSNWFLRYVKLIFVRALGYIALKRTSDILVRIHQFSKKFWKFIIVY